MPQWVNSVLNRPIMHESEGGTQMPLRSKCKGAIFYQLLTEQIKNEIVLIGRQAADGPVRLLVY